MAKKLKRTYYSILVPAVLGFGLAFVLKQLAVIETGEIGQNKLFNVVVFLLAIVASIAAPVFSRSYFAHQHRNEKGISEETLIRFELTLIRIALIAPYTCLVAFLFDFPEFYLAVSFLASLYAVYYFYPSKKRIAFEKRIFRVDQNT